MMRARRVDACDVDGLLIGCMGAGRELSEHYHSTFFQQTHTCGEECVVDGWEQILVTACMACGIVDRARVMAHRC